MEDYSKMTKSELINKLNEQHFLAQAVEAKDNEITSLRKSLKENIAEHSSEIKAIHLHHESEIKELKMKLDNQLSDQSGMVELKKQNDFLVKENKRISMLLSFYISSYRNLMKGLQGMLDGSIDHESLLSEQLQRRE
jgi:hypothetical protein